MSKLNYCCSYCNKHYIMKSAYNNHLIKCKLANFSSKYDKDFEKDLKNESLGLSIDSLKQNMNINNLFAIVIMLYNKYEKMEADYNELKKYVAIVKNKIIIKKRVIQV